MTAPTSIWRMLRVWLPTPGNVLFTVIMVGALLWAQSVGAMPLAQVAPTTTTLPYQGRLGDATGALVTGEFDITFRIYNTSTGGSPLWQEAHTSGGGQPVAVHDGLFSVLLGSTTAIPLSLFTSNLTLYLGIEVGTDGEMSPRLQLGSSPFAALALTVADNSISTAKISDEAVTADKLSPDVTLSLPAGSIIMWAGAVETVPTGWQLCNGTNGTPDLRDRFVVGAGNTYAVGNTGGAAQVTLTTDQLPAHTHSYSDKYTDGNRQDGSHAWDATTDKNPTYTTENKNTGSVGGNQAHENRPPYYAVAMICKS